MPLQQRQQQSQVGQQGLIAHQPIAGSQVLQSNTVVTGQIPQQQLQQQMLQPPVGVNVNQQRLTYLSSQQTRVCIIIIMLTNTYF